MNSPAAIHSLCCAKQLSLSLMLIRCTIAIALTVSLDGCATTDYTQSRLAKQKLNLARTSEPRDIKVTYGGEHPNLDNIESALYFPLDKVRGWLAKRKPATAVALDKNQLREQCLNEVQEFLAVNEMTSMHIDVREYDPAEQWRRLQSNSSITPFWKYSAGTLQHLEYCLLPGRVTRRDRYNVFTNTLSINSTRPEQSLYTAATAKHLLSKDHPGAFSTACYFPIVPLVRDYHVANDVLSYARLKDDWEMEKRLYRQVYSNFGRDVVGQATSLVPQFAYLPFYVEPALSLGGRVVGTGTSYFVIKQRESERAREESQTSEDLLGELQQVDTPEMY